MTWATLRLAAVWTAVAAAAWAGFRVSGAPDWRGPMRWGLWMALVLGTVVVAWRLAHVRRHGLDPAAAALAAWGTAGAAGWFLDVLVGGPFMGGVTWLVLAEARRETARWPAVLATATAVLVGAALGLRASGGRGTLIGLAASVGGAAIAGLLAARAARLHTDAGRFIAFVASWGLAWFVAWWLTTHWSPSGTPSGVALGGEIVIALALCGLAAAVIPGGEARAPFASAGRYAMAGLATALVGALLDTMLRAVLPDSITMTGRATLLDAGHTVGLGLGALLLLKPRAASPVSEAQ